MKCDCCGNNQGKPSGLKRGEYVGKNLCKLCWEKEFHKLCPTLANEEDEED